MAGLGGFSFNLIQRFHPGGHGHKSTPPTVGRIGDHTDCWPHFLGLWPLTVAAHTRQLGAPGRERKGDIKTRKKKKRRRRGAEERRKGTLQVPMNQRHCPIPIVLLNAIQEKTDGYKIQPALSRREFA